MKAMVFYRYLLLVVAAVDQLLDYLYLLNTKYDFCNTVTNDNLIG